MSSDLPDREDWGLADEAQVMTVVEKVMTAWFLGDLKTRDEMDEEAAVMEVVYRHGGHVEDQPLPDEVAHAKRVLDAAWGVGDE